MNVIKTDLDGVFILEPRIFADNRGYFYESFSERSLHEAGIEMKTVQINHSQSLLRGTVRGLHFQMAPMAQTKIVRCLRGKILDVAVDLRKDSPTYKKSFQTELSEENHRCLFIPKGFAHGMATLTDSTEIEYVVDQFYSPQHDRSIRFDDPQLGVKWPFDQPILSGKDQKAPLLADSDCNF